MAIETVIVLLFAVAAVVALVARWLQVPYTVALVVAGLTLGATGTFPTPRLTKELLYAAFLPGLIFEAAFHLGFQNLRQNKLAVLTLAFPGVLVSAGATMGLLVTIRGVGFASWRAAFVFAALISATDPIAVVGLFKTLGAPRRLDVIVEGESLLNDGTSAALYTLAVGMATAGAATFLHASLAFARVVGLGLAIGGAIGFAASKIISRIDDPLVEITLTTAAAYGSFAAAEHVLGSGIIASVAAGVLCGSYGAPRAMSPLSRVAVESFWECVAFALNSIVFLLIGLEVRLVDLLESWRSAVIAFLVVTAVRGCVVFATSLALQKSSERIPWRWSFALTWGGLRGALSMVLALALPVGFPQRHLVVTTTFGVVILSILINGLTAGPLLRRLGLVGTSEGGPSGMPRTAWWP